VLSLILTDILYSRFVKSVFLVITLKNNTEVYSKQQMLCFCFYVFAPIFFTSNFKNNDKNLAPPEIFFAPLRLCWIDYGPAYCARPNMKKIGNNNEFSNGVSVLLVVY